MIVTLLLFILILGVTVLVHEAGHFLFSKLFGVCVYEFSVGMGPAIVSKKSKKSETMYSIRAIPIGGYCSLAGEDNNEEELKKVKGRTLQDKSLIQRFLIMFAGVLFNFIFAFIVLFVIGLMYGAPDKTPIVYEASVGYPASSVGISKGDKILSINDKKVTYIDDVSLYFTVLDMDKEISIKVEKPDESIKTYKLTPKKEIGEDKEAIYYVGIVLRPERQKGILKSLEYAFKQECALFKQMFVVIGSLFTGGVSVRDLSGPVGIYSVVGTMKNEGAASLMYLVALLCVNVGVINLLPFPAFDGGRIVFLIIEKIKKSPVSPKVENMIHSIGFIILIILMIFVTFNDILRLF